MTPPGSGANPSAGRRAVIDIGTNSVKLLIAEWREAGLEPILECSRQTRLGEGFYSTGRLQLGPIQRTAAAVAELAALARAEPIACLRVIATSATREAVNAAELIRAAEASAEAPVEIISGAQEADWAYRGALTDVSLTRTSLMLLDLGGGSTEVILGRGERREFQQSFPLGTVRLLERVPFGDPPTAAELSRCRAEIAGFIESRMVPVLERLVRSDHDRLLVGTGGTASILGCLRAQLTTFDRARLEAARLDLPVLEHWTATLWRMPLKERKEIPGLPPNRADVILPGVVVYEQMTRAFGFRELRISTRGLRFGALLDSAR